MEDDHFSCLLSTDGASHGFFSRSGRRPRARFEGRGALTLGRSEQIHDRHFVIREIYVQNQYVYICHLYIRLRCQPLDTRTIQSRLVANNRS
eukprot:9186204-Pyramimonas_sp.AAC.1